MLQDIDLAELSHAVVLVHTRDSVASGHAWVRRAGWQNIVTHSAADAERVLEHTMLSNTAQVLVLENVPFSTESEEASIWFRTHLRMAAKYKLSVVICVDVLDTFPHLKYVNTLATHMLVDPRLADANALLHLSERQLQTLRNALQPHEDAVYTYRK